MITYTILEKDETNVTLQIEDSSQWATKKEKDIKVKTFPIQKAIELLTHTKQQRQTYIQVVTEKVNAEVQSIDEVLSLLNA